MKKLNILSGKYDGSLRDGYESFLYSETDECFVFFTPPGTKYLDYRHGSWFTAVDGIIEIYFKKKFYKVCHICESGGGRSVVYINIAMPAELSGDTLEWIDLDLDYRLDDDGAISILGRDNFTENYKKMRYPAELIDSVRAACTEVERGLAGGYYPFNNREHKFLYDQIKEKQARLNHAK